MPGTVVVHLCEWPILAAFPGATMDRPAPSTTDDPLARLKAMSCGAGDTLKRHFDRSEFTTTPLLDAPEAGGEFEYLTDPPQATDATCGGGARLLRGKDPDRKRRAVSPGTLNIFRGRNTAHRMAPVQRAQPRIISVFSFHERLGLRFTADARPGFQGRVARGPRAPKGPVTRGRAGDRPVPRGSRSCQAKLAALPKGRSRSLCPVRAKMALPSAGAAGGVPGSPMPRIFGPVSSMRTAMGGHWYSRRGS